MNDGGLNHATNILSERGHFWLAGDLERMSAETATRATLTISALGAIDLTLDKDEWKWADPRGAGRRRAAGRLLRTPGGPG